MTGDGVNDAPALTKADIGVVVGEASDVAKESADLVLLDSSFATIVATIEEGRGIFDNLRKIVLYLMSDAFAAIVIVVGAMLIQAFFIADLPLPLTAAQILWINLVSDGFPHLALTVDPKRKDIMATPPRKPNEKLVTRWMNLLIGAVSVVSGLSGLLVYVFVYHTTSDLELARSAAFAVIGANTLAYVYPVRTLTDPFWNEGIFNNKWLIFAVLGGLGLLLIPFSLPATQGFFEIKPLPLNYWGMVVAVAGLVVVFIEIFKFIYRRLGHSHRIA
jgi:Ca2+-transporting ATPase